MIFKTDYFVNPDFLFQIACYFNVMGTQSLRKYKHTFRSKTEFHAINIYIYSLYAISGHSSL